MDRIVTGRTYNSLSSGRRLKAEGLPRMGEMTPQEPLRQRDVARDDGLGNLAGLSEKLFGPVGRVGVAALVAIARQLHLLPDEED